MLLSIQKTNSYSCVRVFTALPLWWERNKFGCLHKLPYIPRSANMKLNTEIVKSKKYNTDDWLQAFKSNCAFTYACVYKLVCMPVWVSCQIEHLAVCSQLDHVTDGGHKQSLVTRLKNDKNNNEFWWRCESLNCYLCNWVCTVCFSMCSCYEKKNI